MEEWINQNFGADVSSLGAWQKVGIVCGIIVVAYLVDFLCAHVILKLIRKATSKTETQLDDILLSDKVCKRFSDILPPVILTFALPFALKGQVEVVALRLLGIYIIINVCLFLTAVIEAIYNLFIYREHAKARSLKGISQTLQVLVWIIGVILMVSALIDKSPLYLMTGLGAAATVLMLVFQDSIKGLVAGIQLSFNDMLRAGDWIVMPSRNIDGVVTDITLNTVKVRNWDNTILTVQPYALITETFQNWRGMQEADGRRLTRTVNVNMHTVRFCNEQELDRYKKAGWLPETAQLGVATNVEAFRGCVLDFLKKDSGVNESMTLMVRQLTATSEGLPIQIYAFSHTKEWEQYEELQARYAEYMVARMPEFGLLPYQRGSDKMYDGVSTDNTVADDTDAYN